MIKRICSSYALAAAMAMGFFVQSITPDRSEVISRPISLLEAQHTKGAALGIVTIPWSVYIAAITVDAAFVASMVNLFIASSEAEEK